MELEIEELKEEVELLSKKVEILEKKENYRKAYSYTKVIIKIVLIGLFAYGAYLGYEYITKELPNVIEEKIKDLNPLRKYT